MTGLQTTVRRLFSDGRIDALLGWISDSKGATRPYLFTSKDDSTNVVFNDRCVENLATYLATTLASFRNVGIILKGCDGRSFTTLLAEKQVERERIVVLAPACTGVRVNNEKPDKCGDCAVRIAPIADFVFDDPQPVSTPSFTEAHRIQKLSYEERWAFFAGHFQRCDRCYACRQVCPLCYCETCIVDQQDPAWIDPSTKLSSNTLWHLIRAYHLAGRCGDCGECERVCPQHIPLRILATSLEKAVMEMFGTRPGTAPDAPPVLSVFDKESDEGIMGGEK